MEAFVFSSPYALLFGLHRCLDFARCLRLCLDRLRTSLSRSWKKMPRLFESCCRGMRSGVWARTLALMRAVYAFLAMMMMFITIFAGD